MKKQAKLVISTLLLFSFLGGCNSNSSTSTSIVPTTTNPSTSDPSTSSDVPVTGLSLDKESITVDIDEGFSLTATITPEDATDKTISWSSSNNKVELSATSGEAITVTAKDAGSATITASCGNLTATCVVTINEQPKVKIYSHDEHQLIDSVQQEINGVYVDITDTGSDDNVFYYRALEDVNVRVHLSENGYYDPLGLTVGETDMDIDSNGYVTFVADSGEYDFMSITPYFINHTPSTGTNEFHVTNTDHLTIKLYDSDKLNHEITSADSYDVVYAKVTSSDPDYFARSLDFKKSSETYYSKATYDANTGLYHFTTPNADDIDVTATEGNNALLKDTDVPGTYFSIWLTSSTKGITNFDDNKKIVIGSDGSMKRLHGDVTNRSDQITSYTNSTLHTESYQDLPYGENFVFTNDNGSDGFRAPSYVNYDILAIKKQNTNDLDSAYKVDGEIFTISGNRYALINVTYNSNPYFSFLVDYTNKTFKTSVTINMIYGEKISDDKVIYEVYDGTTKLFGVSYTGDGGTANRIPLVSPYGVYSGSNGDFILANSTIGVYDDASFVAVIDGSQVTLSNATRRIVLALDTTNFTYTVVSDEEVISTIPDLKNKAFTCHFHRDEDWVTDEFDCDLVFTFNDYASDDEITTTLSGYSYYTATFTVSYNLDTNVITLTLASQTYAWNTIGSTYTALMADGQMTMQKDYNNILNTKNCVFYCPDFHL